MVDHQALGPPGEVCSLGDQSLPDDLQPVQEHHRPPAKKQAVHVAMTSAQLRQTLFMIKNYNNNNEHINSTLEQ